MLDRTQVKIQEIQIFFCQVSSVNQIFWQRLSFLFSCKNKEDNISSFMRCTKHHFSCFPSKSHLNTFQKEKWVLFKSTAHYCVCLLANKIYFRKIWMVGISELRSADYLSDWFSGVCLSWPEARCQIEIQEPVGGRDAVVPSCFLNSPVTFRLSACHRSINILLHQTAWCWMFGVQKQWVESTSGHTKSLLIIVQWWKSEDKL